MALTKKGQKIKTNMDKEYGDKKGDQVFYASKNKGTISGTCSGGSKKATKTKTKKATKKKSK